MKSPAECKRFAKMEKFAFCLHFFCNANLVMERGGAL